MKNEMKPQAMAAGAEKVKQHRDIPPHVLKQTARAADHNKRRVMLYAQGVTIPEEGTELGKRFDATLEELNSIVKEASQADAHIKAFIISNLFTAIQGIAEGE